MSTENITSNLKLLQRLNEAVDALGANKAKVADVTGYSRGQVGWILEGKTNISGKFVKIFCSSFNISERWLKTGEGEMFVAEEKGHGTTEEEHQEYREEFNERKFLLKGIEKETEELTTAEFYKLMGALHEVIEDLRKKRKGGQ